MDGASRCAERAQEGLTQPSLTTPGRSWNLLAPTPHLHSLLQRRGGEGQCAPRPHQRPLLPLISSHHGLFPESTLLVYAVLLSQNVSSLREEVRSSSLTLSLLCPERRLALGPRKWKERGREAAHLGSSVPQSSPPMHTRTSTHSCTRMHTHRCP